MTLTPGARTLILKRNYRVLQFGKRACIFLKFTAHPHDHLFCVRSSILEAFFRKIAIHVEKNDWKLQDFLNTTSLRSATKRSISSGDQATMSAVNEALRDSSFRGKVWNALNISPDVVLPEMSAKFLYGDVSTYIHSATVRRVYLASMTPRRWVMFYNEVLRVLDIATTIELYSEVDAYHGSSLIDSAPSALENIPLVP